MVISASRRTDIPAFYSRWFLNRIKAGEVMVRNPFDKRKVSRVSLRQEHVDFIHFWTKNPAPMISRLDELEGYDYAFHFTVNGYGKQVEPRVPKLPRLLDTFAQLADKCPGRVSWRYCPILINEKFGLDGHLRNFEDIASRLQGMTSRCHISLLDEYGKIKTSLARHGIRTPDPREQEAILSAIPAIAGKYGISLYSCADKAWEARYGIIPGRCLEPAVVGRNPLGYRKDKNQRAECLCCESVDIGGYSSCPHDCVYCYANRSGGTPASEFARHTPLSPLITGEPQPGDIITEHSLSAKARKLAGQRMGSLFTPDDI